MMQKWVYRSEIDNFLGYRKKENIFLVLKMK